MKKLLSLLLVLMMVLAGAAFAEAAGYVGTWVLTGLETAGMAMDMTMLNQLGMDMTMTLNADGTMFTTTMGVTENGTWAVTEKGIAITDDEETIELTCENDVLRLEDEGAAMLLTREGAAPAVTAQAAEASGGEPVDFVAGYWVMTGVEMAGMQVDPSMLGLSAYMELYDDGTCLMVMLDDVQYGTWVATETGIETTDAEGVVDPFTLVDGALVIEQEGNKLIFTQEVYTVPLSGLTAADFEGEWVFTYVELGNEAYSADEVGMSMTLSIKDGKGVHVTTYAEETGEVTESFNGVCETEEIPDFGTVMYFLYTDEAGNPTNSGLMLLMFDNEDLVWYIEDETGMAICYCFVKAE